MMEREVATVYWGPRDKRKIGKIALATCALLGIGVTTASAAPAGLARSPLGFYTVNGVAYENQAQVETGSAALGITIAATQNGQNVSAGWMGALARLYKNNALCAQWGYIYNSVPAYYQSAVTQGSGCGSGEYYSYGVTKAYNGNGYNAYFTFQSPSLNQSAVLAYPKNASGLTYGSALIATSPAGEPALILTYATNGKIGYTKRIDLEDNPRTPQAALRRASHDRQIPVYLEDGKTVIGAFTIHGSSTLKSNH